MYKWYVRWRVDTEEVFTTEDGIFEICTSNLVMAAQLMEKELGYHNTLIELRREDV